MSWNKTLEKIALSVPWIGKYEYRIVRLESLLREASASSGSAGDALIDQLIQRFSYLTGDEYEEMLICIADYVAGNFDLVDTILCATTADRHKDSAQKVLYDLTSMFALRGFYKVRTLNRYDSLQKEKMPFKSVILVDEFIGSGQSIVGRVATIKRVFGQAGKACPEIHAIAIAGMQDSLRVIESKFSSLNVCVALRRGIAQHASPENICSEYEVMSKLEALLAQISHGEALPSLGYARSEALYSRQNGSCPNNVFPIFWWPELTSGQGRSPLFPRAL